MKHDWEAVLIESQRMPNSMSKEETHSHLSLSLSGASGLSANTLEMLM